MRKTWPGALTAILSLPHPTTTLAGCGTPKPGPLWLFLSVIRELCGAVGSIQTARAFSRRPMMALRGYGLARPSPRLPSLPDTQASSPPGSSPRGHVSRRLRVTLLGYGMGRPELPSPHSPVYHAPSVPTAHASLPHPRDHTARLWDAATGALLQSLRDHTGEIWSCAFSPHGKRIAMASADHTARVWDVDTGTSTVLAGHGADAPGAA
jgi:WD domain, G-beta repeat